jgi:hypothetical protein
MNDRPLRFSSFAPSFLFFFVFFVGFLLSFSPPREGRAERRQASGCGVASGVRA